MSENNPLFRKAALDKLSSPERLDVLMQVTSPQGWLALGTIGTLLVGLIVWSIVGTIPTKLDGEGMLIRGGSLREIRSSGDGVLEQFKLDMGQVVNPGLELGTIRRVDIQEKAVLNQENCNRLRAEAGAVAAEQGGVQIGLRAQIASANDELDRAKSQLAKAEEEVRFRNDQLTKGLGTRNQVLAAEKDVEGIRVRMASIQGQGRQYQAQIASTEQMIRGAQMRAAQACGEAVAGKVTGEAQSKVLSEVAGKVIELRARKGDTVRTGQVIAIVEPEDATMEAIVYFDARTAKQIRIAHEAQVSPTDVKREEFGFIKAEVANVGEGPVSLDKMKQDLANDVLAQELLGKSAKIEVRTKLITDTSTPSGLSWSSSVGPPFQISGNTRINVSVVVDRKPPYTYVLPLVKKTLGAS
ncbi:MAG: NHLP bacteriocin system secretion protein [Vicinamibacterales bacterium]